MNIIHYDEKKNLEDELTAWKLMVNFVSNLEHVLYDSYK